MPFQKRLDTTFGKIQGSTKGYLALAHSSEQYREEHDFFFRIRPNAALSALWAATFRSWFVSAASKALAPFRQVCPIMGIDAGCMRPFCPVFVTAHPVPLQWVSTECFEARAAFKTWHKTRLLHIFIRKSRIGPEFFQFL